MPARDHMSITNLHVRIQNRIQSFFFYLPDIKRNTWTKQCERRVQINAKSDESHSLTTRNGAELLIMFFVFFLYIFHFFYYSSCT